jgi:hypothetical protein
MRRTRPSAGLIPVAAEVLEVRALLSSSAAAVHHHGHGHGHAQTHFNGPATAAVTIGANTPVNAAGTYQMNNVKIVDGSQMTAHFHFKGDINGHQVNLQGTFLGKIASSLVNGTTTTVTVNPHGGNIRYSDTFNGTTSSGTAFPNGTQMTLVFENGVFSSLTVTDAFGASASPSLANQTISLTITPG